MHDDGSHYPKCIPIILISYYVIIIINHILNKSVVLNLLYFIDLSNFLNVSNSSFFTGCGNLSASTHAFGDYLSVVCRIQPSLPITSLTHEHDPLYSNLRQHDDDQKTDNEEYLELHFFTFDKCPFDFNLAALMVAYE